MSAKAWTPWRVVLGFGFVSLAADVVYEGARSIYGPLLGVLGASALVVGFVTGAGEAVALILRLVFGPLADRTGAYWSLTILGYGLTAVSVPLLAVTPELGGVGLVVAALLILIERAGKAIRSPSKSALLAQAARSVGRGRGFGVHKALDQVGAFAGPLLVAGVLALTGSLEPALAVLAVPGVAAMILLGRIRRAVPDLAAAAPEDTAADPGRPVPATAPLTTPPASALRGLRAWLGGAFGEDLPPIFFRYAAAASLTTGGLVTFGLIGFHLVQAGVVTLTQVPLIYAGAMLVEALAALFVGAAFDRVGARTLLLVPALVAGVAPLALSGVAGAVAGGVVLWGCAMGVQDSTIKAAVADLVPSPRRATAYGVFAGIQGLCALIGGLATGWLYQESLLALTIAVAVSQVVAFALLLTTVTGRPGVPGAPPGRLSPRRAGAGGSGTP